MEWMGWVSMITTGSSSSAVRGGGARMAQHGMGEEGDGRWREGEEVGG